ncbi:MAG: ABC transporter ATP-binding protein [Bacteroidota bacterium]
MQAYFRIIANGRSYFWLAAPALISLLVYTLFSAVSLVSVIPFLEILFSDGSPSPPELPLEWWSTTSLKAHGYYALGQAIHLYGPQQVLLRFCGFLVTTILLKNGGRYFTNWFIAPLEHGIIQRLRDRLFQKMSQLSLGFFSQRKKGELMSVVVNDVQVVQESVVGTLLALVREPISMITFLLALLVISWKLTLFTLIILPITGLIINAIAGPLRRATRKGQQALAELTSLLDEILGGIRIVKAFRKEAYVQQQYEQKNDAYTRLMVNVRRRADLASPLTEVMSIGVVCTIIYYGSLLILAEESSLKASEFIGFIAIFSQVLSPIKVLSNALTKMQKGIAAYERVEQMLNMENPLQDPAQPTALASFQSALAFEEVWFRYQEEDVLRDVSFELKKGQTIALVGPSGGGKTTLAELVPRFYDPYQGQITLDGIPLPDLRLAELRNLIGYVNQEAILFHDTIRRNIAFGEPEIDQQSLEAAAKIAHAHEFIMELPTGYDTLIGDRGTRLSGGQRQRIAIARAILHNPPILLLDEATSNLDVQSEQLVQAALDELMNSRTTLVIAHRLSTVIHADQILVIDAGRIVERGTHHELLAKAGLYHSLHEIQFHG